MSTMPSPVLPVSVSVAVTVYVEDVTGHRFHGPGPESRVPSLPCKTNVVGPQPRGVAVISVHPPVHNVSELTLRMGAGVQPDAVQSAERSVIQMESHASLKPTARSAVMSQLPSIETPSSSGRVKVLALPPRQLIPCAAAVSTAQLLPFSPTRDRLDQSMRAHSMGGVKLHCTAEKGQEPTPVKMEMGGIGGGGLADHNKWKPSGWALASEINCTVNAPWVL